MSERSSFKLQISWTTLLAVVFSSVATLAFVYIFVLKYESEPDVSSLATSKTVTVDAVAALGRLEPQGEVIDLSAPVSLEGARLEKLLVKLGDRVKSGQIIAILDSRDRLQAALSQTKTQVKVKQANLAKIEAGAKIGTLDAQKAVIERLEAELQGQMTAQKATIDRFIAELQNAKTECQRYQTLYQDGAISISAKDNICLQEKTLQEGLQEAKANRSRTLATLTQQLAEAKAILSEIAEVRSVDIALAEAELETARSAVEQAEANLKLAYVYTPKAGQILKIQTFPGEMIRDKGIVSLGDTEQMNAIAEVYETDINKVKIGQRATLTSSGFSGELSGTVVEIGLQIGKKDILGTDPAADVDSRVVEVKIRLNPSASQKVRGLTNLQVNVIIDLASPLDNPS